MKDNLCVGGQCEKPSVEQTDVGGEDFMALYSVERQSSLRYAVWRADLNTLISLRQAECGDDWHRDQFDQGKNQCKSAHDPIPGWASRREGAQEMQR